MCGLFTAGCPSCLRVNKYPSTSLRVNSPHPYSLPLALALVLVLACAAIPARAQQGKRIWTTDDMEDLRARGLISIVGPETPTAPEAATPAPVPVPVRFYNTRTEDPVWYADQASELQAQLDATMTALVQARDSLAQARNLRGITGSVNLAQGNAGVTPEAGIVILEAQVLEARSRLDELADLARRNDIAPGILRGATA